MKSQHEPTISPVFFPKFPTFSSLFPRFPAPQALHRFAAARASGSAALWWRRRSMASRTAPRRSWSSIQPQRTARSHDVVNGVWNSCSCCGWLRNHQKDGRKMSKAEKNHGTNRLSTGAEFLNHPQYVVILLGK